MQKPSVLYTKLNSFTHLIRFDDIKDILWYDNEENNPNGISVRNKRDFGYELRHYQDTQFILTPEKQKIMTRAKKQMSMDREFLELIYKAKSTKRKYDLNKFGGNLSMPHYATNSDKVFKKMHPGAKKATLNLAFQVGTFSNGDYTGSFVKILKTIMMCQAMNISVNIDVFDSDTNAINEQNSYVICNIAKSHEKLNFNKILLTSNRCFFNYTLFNGYSASGKQESIGTFLSERTIIKDLGDKYDVIGGNTLQPSSEHAGNEMVSRILKIGLK